MKAKKSIRADLRNKSTLFLEIGMVIALAIVFAAFQWSPETKNNTFRVDGGTEIITDELPPITRPEPPKLAEMPKYKSVEVIIVPDDGIEIPDADIPDLEGNLEIPINIIDIAPELPDNSEPEIFIKVEEMPVYPGGAKALLKDIMSRVVYPEIAKETGTQGKVYIEFVVNTKGEVDRVKIVRGVDKSLDNEAIRVIKTLTGWTPGKQRGKPVNVAFTVPINFQLN